MTDTLRLFLAVLLLLSLMAFFGGLRWENEATWSRIQFRAPKIESDELSPTSPCYRFAAGSTGLVLVESKGRLGNQMGEYATALGVAKAKGARPVITEGLRSKLLPLFPSLSVHLRREDLSWSCIMALTDVRPYVGDFAANVRKNHLVRIVDYPIMVNEFYPVASQLKTVDFSFNAKILDKVSHFLTEVKSSTAPLRASVFVGVHVRRTDYRKWLGTNLGSTLLTEKFFQRAMNLLTYELLKKKAITRDTKLIYIVASDDPTWCKDKFSSFNATMIYTSDWYPRLKEIQGNASFEAMELEHPVDPVYFDLAVLANCNHSIFDYGTFGFWGAYLADGVTILADVDSHLTKKYVIEDQILNAHLPDWHFLPVHLGNATDSYGSGGLTTNAASKPNTTDIATQIFQIVPTILAVWYTVAFP